MQTTEPVTAKAVQPKAEGLLIRLADREVLVPWSACSPKLAAASGPQRETAELSPGGYGVHWPAIDEDLTVAGLLRRATGETVHAPL